MFDFDFDSGSSIDDFFVSDKSKRRVASYGDLSGFLFTSSDKLVHLAQKDFWKLGCDEDGFFIERLVEDGEGPVKL